MRGAASLNLDGYLAGFGLESFTVFSSTVGVGGADKALV